MPIFGFHLLFDESGPDLLQHGVVRLEACRLLRDGCDQDALGAAQVDVIAVGEAV